MNYQRLLIAPLIASALLFSAAGLYSVPVVEARQQRSAHSKKPTQYHFVCPMHENVTSKKRGTCYKCKMKLVRKPVPKEEPTTGSN